MEKQDFHQYIKNRITQIESIKQVCETSPIKEEITEEQWKNVQIVFNYLSFIDRDLEDGSLPSDYCTKIQHNIQELKIDTQSWNTEDLSTINIHVLKNELSNLNSAAWHFHTYLFYRDLNFFNQNIVVVGANGSGKSSLASMLKNTIDERDGIVIPAQKLLIIPTFNSIPSYNSSNQEYDTYQKQYQDSKTTYNASKDSDIPYSETQKYGAEYKHVLRNLIAERIDIRNKFCDDTIDNRNPDKTDLYSKLDKALDIWNSLIEHRTIFCDSSNNIKLKTLEEEIYPAHQMSDGEKLILFLIGRILLAPPNALIVIDEPEMYLHKAIVNKLWDRLEAERLDCLFVYLTHDLEFASSRLANKYWIESFKHPLSWKIEPIPDNEIPQELLMKLLGSRKKILFCEGKVNSLDVQIFECLFNQYTIIPVQSCTDVINYTRAYNKLPNKNSIAYGVIDRDFRVQEQLDKLKTENIYSYSVAEIENLFLIEDFILKYADFKNETFDINSIKNKVLELLKNNIDQQTSNYVSSHINYNFTESHVKKGNTKDEVDANFDLFKNNIQIKKWYYERKSLIESIISSNDYVKAIMIYNNKGLHSAVENVLGLASKVYRSKALDFLQQDKDAQDIIRSVFPSELTD